VQPVEFILSQASLRRPRGFNNVTRARFGNGRESTKRGKGRRRINGPPLSPPSRDRHSKLFMAIATASAEPERDRIRERIGQVKADQKARGRYLGGSVPFGYRLGDDDELVPHEAEQEAGLSVRRADQDFAVRPEAFARCAGVRER
jgi:DNA invertase Pin-like site-specific DNA recombinase